MSKVYRFDVVNKALSQVGYQGQTKSSKYSKELDAVNYYNTKKNGACTWCAIFYDWCVWSSTEPIDTDFARSTVCEPNKGNAGAGCTQKAEYYKAAKRWYSKCKDAISGDQIFFKKSNGSIYHTGIVVDWDGNGLYVVEGSTNGAQVAKKYYKYSDSKIAGFGRPKWSGDQKQTVSDNKPVSNLLSDAMITNLAVRVIRGDFGNGAVRKSKLNGLGYGDIYSIIQKRVNQLVES